VSKLLDELTDSWTLGIIFEIMTREENTDFFDDAVLKLVKSSKPKTLEEKIFKLLLLTLPKNLVKKLTVGYRSIRRFVLRETQSD
jgi:sulfur relay (sulfurtransferase) DsrF/TusC family protein